MKIGILRRNGLGDLLCAYPLILYLQKQYPHASITLFVDQRNAPLIPYLPKVERVEVFPAHGNKYWCVGRMAFRYRKKIDMAISAKTSPMKLANFFLYLLGAKERIAYVHSERGSFCINRPIVFRPEEAAKKHQALKGLQTVLPDLTEIPEEFYPTITIPEEIREKYSIQKSRMPTLLISATTTKPSSRLNPLKYAQLLNRLHEEFPFAVTLIGQNDDQRRAEAIASHLAMQHHVHFPRNFDEFMVLLESAHMFFVGDGGIAHIGAAMRKPTVVLFGETNPIEWSPLSKIAEVFYHPSHVDDLPDEPILQALKRSMRLYVNQ